MRHWNRRYQGTAHGTAAPHRSSSDRSMASGATTPATAQAARRGRRPGGRTRLLTVAGTALVAATVLASCSSSSSGGRDHDDDHEDQHHPDQLGAVDGILGSRRDVHPGQRRSHLEPDRRHRRRLRRLRTGVRSLPRQRQRPRRRQRAESRRLQQPRRRQLTGQLHPAVPYPDPAGPRLRRGRCQLLVHAGPVRVLGHADLRLQRQRQLAGAGQPVRRRRIGAGLQRPGPPPIAYAIKQTHSSSVAVISYGSAISSSYDACNATPRVCPPVASRSATPTSPPSSGAPTPRPSSACSRPGPTSS